MLSSLRIQNLALVEDLSVELSEGFTVLTGETGAGKSLLVDALALLVGARGDGDLVRSGCERATVEAVIEGAYPDWSAFLAERGLPEEQPVVLRREVGASSRSRAWINGAHVSLGDLKEAGRIWMRLTSQHDHQSLMAEERHLALLDEILGLQADLGPEVDAVREASARLRARRRSEAEREQRLDWLAEQIGDLEKLAPRPGEFDQLRAEREPLRHAAQLEQAFREAAETLREALTPLETAQRALARAVSVLPDTQRELDRLRSGLLEFEDLQALAQDQAIRWSREGVERIEVLEARLALFEKLARRHRCEPEELAPRLTELKAEQKDLLGGESSLQELARELEQASAAYLLAAERLHDLRSAGIPELEREAQARLKRLGMGGTRVQFRLAVAPDPDSPALHQGRPVRVSPAGFSALAIWAETNVGEGFKPLARIASGGELSRMMLALMGAGLATGRGAEEPLTLVLDEVDAGLGGETALAVGTAIHELAAVHQVLAVTHLAQVAAKAHHHGRLSKETRQGRTRSGLEWLDEAARSPELARLLSGHPDRPEALAHARTLLG
nr:AAA family ATPase [uncultured Holophaga sp.]